MSPKDYYQTLGVAKTASAEEIKKAHRRLARQYHPDLNPGDKVAESKFKEIQEAYDVLSEPQRREKYDKGGEAWNPAGGPPPPGSSADNPFNVGFGGGNPYSENINIDDMFVRMFGNIRTGGPKSERSAAPAEDVEFTLNITLEDAYRGGNQTLNVTVEDVCPTCDGSGQKRDARGRFDLSGGGCLSCKGTGRMRSPRSGQITVPPGAWDGLRMKLSGEGAADSKGRRGDLYVQLHLLPHAKFERDGQDIQFEVAIPYTIAALGGEATIELLDGSRRQMMVPPGIQTGQKLRISGQGMPALRDRKAGDAYAKIKITVPRDLSTKERSLLEEIAEIRRDSIRKPAG